MEELVTQAKEREVTLKDIAELESCEAYKALIEALGERLEQNRDLLEITINPVESNTLQGSIRELRYVLDFSKRCKQFALDNNKNTESTN